MFLTLLIATILISLVISWFVVRLFSSPIERILHRITSDETSRAWLKFVKFAIYVSGVSSGTGLKASGTGLKERSFLEIRMDEFEIGLLGLELYETAIGAFRGIFWFLARFFIAAAIAFLIVRVVEVIKQKRVDTQDRA